MSRRRALPVAVGALLLLPAAPLAAQQATPDVPASELASSVATIDLDRAVRTIDLSGSVVPLEVTEQQGATTTVTVSSDVLFDFASATLTEAAAARLRTLAAEVPAGAAVAVVGHTDDVGEAAANDVLSLGRAEAVAAVLRSAAPGLSVTTEGRGEREPVAPNSSGGEDDPAGRASNRRVVLSYQG